MRKFWKAETWETTILYKSAKMKAKLFQKSRKALKKICNDMLE